MVDIDELERLRGALENIGNLSLDGCIKVNTPHGLWVGTPDAYAREVLGMPWRAPEGHQRMTHGPLSWHELVRREKQKSEDARGQIKRAAMPVQADPVPNRWQLGDKVKKKRGSSWRGTVCGFYSTPHTPEGYCVDSAFEPGSVQVWPEAALEDWDGGSDAE